MEIIRIVIKSESGYVPMEQAYSEKLTLTESSIKYVYKQASSNTASENRSRKWSYSTDSDLFKKIYKQVAEMTLKYLKRDDLDFIMDVSPIEVIATFDDRHRESITLYCTCDDLLEYFDLIKKMIPKIEELPKMFISGKT